MHTTVAGKTTNGKEKDRVSRKLRLKFSRRFLSTGSEPFVYDTHSYIISYRLHAISMDLNSQASCFELPCNQNLSSFDLREEMCIAENDAMRFLYLSMPMLNFP
jgi:hypothetical protein